MTAVYTLSWDKHMTNVAVDLLLDPVTLVETFYAAGSIQQLLGTGIERMVESADFNLEVGNGALCLDGETTGALYFSQFVFRVNALLHLNASISPPAAADVP